MYNEMTQSLAYKKHRAAYEQAKQELTRYIDAGTAGADAHHRAWLCLVVPTQVKTPLGSRRLAAFLSVCVAGSSAGIEGKASGDEHRRQQRSVWLSAHLECR